MKKTFWEWLRVVYNMSEYDFYALNEYQKQALRNQYNERS